MDCGVPVVELKHDTDKMLLLAVASHQKSSILGTRILKVVGEVLLTSRPNETGTIAPKFEKRPI